MKANIQNPNIRDIMISLTEKETGTAAMFYATFKKTLHIVMLTKPEDSVICFTGVLRKQGTGKKTASDKVVRLRHKKSNYIFTSDSIKETDPAGIIEFSYEGFLSTSEMDKARQVFNYGISSMADKASAITRDSLKRITNAMKQSIDRDKDQIGITDRVNKNADEVIKKEEVADVVEKTVEEVVPEVVEDIVEETLLEKLIAIEESSETQIAKNFVNRLLDVPFDESVLDKIKELDTGYFYNQGICIQYQEAVSEADVIKVKIAEVQKAIDNLTQNLKRFKHNLKETESKISRLKGIMEELTSVNLYNEINEYVTKLEEENTAQKLAEKKIAEIMSSLSSETEVELLKKALGMTTVSTEVLPDAVGTADVNISLIDGNSITDKDGGWSWAEVKSHLVDVAQHRASASLKILEFIKAQNLSRKELESKLTQRYASVAIDEMTKVGLYKKRNNNFAMMTPEQRKARAAKAAASRKRNLAAKLAVLENSSVS